MGISILAQRNAMATAYGVAAPYGSLFTSTGPGTTGAATNECTGGSPAFARQALGWGAASASAVTGTGTFPIASGTTVTYAGVVVSNVLATADVRDAVAVTSQSYSSQGTYAATITFTET